MELSPNHASCRLTPLLPLQSLHEFVAFSPEAARIRQRRTGIDMKNCNPLITSGPAAAVLLAGVLVLANGCVQERVTHVTTYPVPVQAPIAPPPPPVVTPPPQVIELPPAPPPAPLVPMRSAAELDRMLAPIALYPDPLLAQILPAATLPEQVVMADRYLREGGNLNLVDAQPWDNSLKALARYPMTLRMLDENLAWTTDLGQAFINQPADVMESVQRLRAQARAVGNLQSAPQQTVVISGGIIEILPPAPEVIYVPVYQPEVVYVQPPPPGHFHISFGPAFVVGAWLNHDCDWHHHEVIVWHHDHPRPPDWWSGPPTRREAPTTIVNNVTVVNNTTIVNQNVTVWHPQTRAGAVDRGDRGWAKPQTTAMVTPARQPTTTAPAVNEARPGQPVAQRAPVQPPKGQAAVTKSPEARVVPREAAPPQAAPAPARPPSTAKPVVAQAPAPVNARGNNGQQLITREVAPVARPKPALATPKEPRPAAAPVASRQASSAASAARPAAPPQRAPSSALTGIESSQAARQASVRGQESRAAAVKPIAAPRQAAPGPSAKAKPAAAKKPQQARPN